MRTLCPMRFRPLFLLLALPLAEAAAPLRPDIEDDLLAELNFVRAHPREYAEGLRTYRTYFEGRVVYYPGNPDGLLTVEGVKAVDEAIAFLERQRPLEPLTESPLLALAARDHVVEQGRTGALGHASADGGHASERVVRRGGGRYVGETITYGPPSAGEAVRQLIVDDNVPGRGHRRIVFSEEFTFAGAACGPHKRYRMMCVVDYARTPDGDYR